jgi:membrane protease YdiL (CAAX protease family)
MRALIPLVLVAGLVGTMLAWRAIVHGRAVWLTLPPLLGVLGVLSLLLLRTVEAPTPGGGDVPGLVGLAAIGLISGLVFYLATRVFVVLAVRVPVFRRHVVEAYREAGTATDVREVALSLLIAVPGEELLWRGLAYRWGAEELSSLAAAAVLVWLAYIVANAPSGSLPIIAGAIVGGALWGGLAWWSGGVVAPLASHILWTGAMLAFPPRVAGAKGSG